MANTIDDKIDSFLLDFKARDQRLKAEIELERAIGALTYCLAFEWENELRPEIEALNDAHLRWMDAKLRELKAQ